MKVLLFQAAVTAAANLAMTEAAEALRLGGHKVGVRSLPHFRRESEPAEKVLIALSPSQAHIHRNLAVEVVTIFGTDKIVAVELPEDDEKLQDFDWEGVLGDLGEPQADGLSLDELKAQAIERGLEVTAASTPAQLAHSLDIDLSDGAQASDRITDRSNMDGTAESRVGLRTSSIMPQAGGLDLERMNDEQLKSVAAQLGLRVPSTVSRPTLINKITKTYAEKATAPTDAAPISPVSSTAADDLAGLDADALKSIAEREGVDLGRATSADTITTKITEAREAKVNNG